MQTEKDMLAELKALRHVTEYAALRQKYSGVEGKLLDMGGEYIFLYDSDGQLASPMDPIPPYPRLPDYVATYSFFRRDHGIALSEMALDWELFDYGIGDYGISQPGIREAYAPIHALRAVCQLGFRQFCEIALSTFDRRQRIEEAAISRRGWASSVGTIEHLWRKEFFLLIPTLALAGGTDCIILTICQWLSKKRQERKSWPSWIHGATPLVVGMSIAAHIEGNHETKAALVRDIQSLLSPSPCSLPWEFFCDLAWCARLLGCPVPDEYHEREISSCLTKQKTTPDILRTQLDEALNRDPVEYARLDSTVLDAARS